MMRQSTSVLSLMTSLGTLTCCALPALLVAIGAGAVFAGLVSTFPQIIWLSENKDGLFIVAGLLLILAGGAQYHARRQSCPTDPKQAKACQTTRGWSFWIYLIAIAVYLIGVSFAYVLPIILDPR